MTTIELKDDQAALVVGDHGYMELFLPSYSDDALVPGSVVALAAIAALFKSGDTEFSAYMGRIVDEFMSRAAEVENEGKN